MDWNQQKSYVNLQTTETLLFILIAQRRIETRPDRIGSLAVKKRPKAFSLLMKPREQARVEIRKNGHPKKIK
ncbi:MAG: hypothetical protein KAT04_02010 [Methylococcales bacterium]|nr:hypothetical protein [Methylococcales bacterium]